MNKLRRTIPIIALLGTLLFAPSTTATSQACNDPDGGATPYYFSGESPTPSGSTSHWGARAGLDPSDTDFHACTGGNIFIEDGFSSMWVAIVPAPGNPQYGNPNAIIQIGIGIAHSPGEANTYFTDRDEWHIAHYDRQVRKWYAFGGCNGTIPRPRDIAANDLDNDQAWISAIQHPGGIDFHMGVGANNRVNDWPLRIVGDYMSELSCWLPGSTSEATTKPIKTAYMGERWDSGDDNGDLNATGEHSNINNAYYQNAPASWPTQNWVSQSWTPQAICNFRTGTDAGCKVLDSNSLTLWDT